jgi:hypothetical protein
MIRDIISPEHPEQICANRNYSQAIETVPADGYYTLLEIDFIALKPQSFADQGARPV